MGDVHAPRGAGRVGAMVESSAMSGAEKARGRPRRRLNRVDYMVRVPLGLLTMIVLAIIAVPAMIYMTALYYLVRWTGFLFAGRRPQRTQGANREERVA
jgi:hypothetical protein